MRSAAPDRIIAAVEALGVSPGESVLEIGCGSGYAAGLVCDRLADGRMLAIDRSLTRIERARRRLAAHVASGRLRLEAVPLARLDVGEDRFYKVFAINVNVFWVGPATAELERVRGALAPGGTLFLFYETPAPARARHVVERATRALRAGDFRQPEVIGPDGANLCLISSPA